MRLAIRNRPMLGETVWGADSVKAAIASVPIAARIRIYLIMPTVCLILLFYAIQQSAPIIVEPGAILGLGSYLHPTYWIGLGTLVLCSVSIVADRDIKRDSVFLYVLLVLGLYLVGVSVFTEPLPRAPEAYHPTVIGEDLLAEGHLPDASEEYYLGSYRSWPVTQLLSASLLASTEADVIPLIRYAPLFWMILFVLIIYAFGKRLSLSPNLCFGLAFLALASWFTQQDFSPQGIAMLLYLLLLFLIIPPDRSWQKNLLIVLAFVCLTLTHSLTPLAVVAGSALILLFTRRINLLLFLLAFWATWYVMAATYAFEEGLKEAMERPLHAFTFLFSTEKTAAYEQPLSFGRTFWRSSQLSYFFLYISLVALSGFLHVKMTVKGQDRRSITLLFLFLMGIPATLFVAFVEATTRTYMYSLIPVIAIVMLTFYKSRAAVFLIGLVMVITIVLNMPAKYGAEASWSQVLPSELAGGKFYAERVNPDVHQDKTYYYNYAGFLILYHNPDLLAVRTLSSNQIQRALDKPSLSPLSEWVRYVILSKQGTDVQFTSWGEAPFQLWPLTPEGRKADLLYTNGHYQIYENARSG